MPPLKIQDIYKPITKNNLLSIKIIKYIGKIIIKIDIIFHNFLKTISICTKCPYGITNTTYYIHYPF